MKDFLVWLQVGDQLVSVNGYRVDDAVHAELVHYLASQSRLKIKVRRKYLIIQCSIILRLQRQIAVM